MRNVYVPIAAFLSLLLVLVAPRFSNQLSTASDVLNGTERSRPTAQQLVQDDSNDSNVNPPQDQPGDSTGNGSSDSPDQLGSQPGDQNGDMPQPTPPDDNGGESPQMGANPDESNNPDQSEQNPEDQHNQNPDDQQNQQSTPDL